jgi:hypothetical protein
VQDEQLSDYWSSSTSRGSGNFSYAVNSVCANSGLDLVGKGGGRQRQEEGAGSVGGAVLCVVWEGVNAQEACLAP